MHRVLFNLETTGLWPQADAIFQIAAARMQGGVIQDESFNTFVRSTPHAAGEPLIAP